LPLAAGGPGGGADGREAQAVTARNACASIDRAAGAVASSGGTPAGAGLLPRGKRFAVVILGKIRTSTAASATGQSWVRQINRCEPTSGPAFALSPLPAKSCTHPCGYDILSFQPGIVPGIHREVALAYYVGRSLCGGVLCGGVKVT
jgi:hypothetical protein